jgi:hypothetical protein
MRFVVLPVLVAGEFLLHRVDPELFRSGIPVAAGLVGYGFLWVPRTIVRVAGAAVLLTWSGWVLAFAVVAELILGVDAGGRLLSIPIALLHLALCLGAAQLLALEMGVSRPRSRDAAQAPAARGPAAR